MRDPLRIPLLLEHLRSTWEAQPDLSLPQLWARLEARGVALNSTDGELAAALADELATHPGRLRFPSLADNDGDKATRETHTLPGATPPGAYLVNTESPSHTVTLHLRTPHSAWAIVRRRDLYGSAHHGRRVRRHPVRTSTVGGEASGKRTTEQVTAIPPQPAVWQVSELTRCAVGAPLVMVDHAGTSHRFGVIVRMTALGGSRTHQLPVSPGGLTEGLWILRGADATVQLRGGRADVWSVQRRELLYSSLRWNALSRTAGDEAAEAFLESMDGATIPLGRAGELLQVE